nr:zinc finger, CCHC-type [Tanacetum cinerariifolium]
MLVSMTPEIQKNLEDRIAFDILPELKTMFQQQAEQELFETVKAFHACKQEEGQFVSTYVLKMKGYLDQMEHLGYPNPLVLGVNFILTLLSKDYDQFIQNYNMSILLRTQSVITVTSLDTGGGNVLSIWQSCRKIKLARMAHQGLKGIQKLNKDALDLYVGNGNRAFVEAIGCFDLILPSGMVLLFDNFHFAPSITIGVISLSRLWDNAAESANLSAAQRHLMLALVGSIWPKMPTFVGSEWAKELERRKHSAWAVVVVVSARPIVLPFRLVRFGGSRLTRGHVRPGTGQGSSGLAMHFDLVTMGLEIAYGPDCLTKWDV